MFRLTNVIPEQIIFVSRGIPVLAYCKPWDPVGSIDICTLYDTIFYKPEDDPMGSKHVALVLIA